MPKRSRYSYSSLSQYRACPAAWKQHYLDGEPGIVPQNVRDGAMTHDGIERYAKVCFNDGKRPRKYDREAGFHIADSYPEPVRSTLTRFVENWQWEWGQMVGAPGVCPVEQELTAPLPCGRTFSGHIDLLRRFEGAASSSSFFGDDDESEAGDGDLWVVTDWKNRYYAAEQVQVRPGFYVPLQPLVYAWIVQSNYSEARNFSLRYHLLTGYEVGPWDVAGDLSWVGELLSERSEVMDRDEEREPCMGIACEHCFHCLTCPLHDTATWRRHTNETPESKLQQYLWHKAQADALVPSLKEVAQASGLIAIPGYTYEGRHSTSLALREGVDLAAFGLAELDLKGDWNKQKINRAAKKIEDETLREAFLECWEERLGSLVYKAYKSDAGRNDDETPEAAA